MHDPSRGEQEQLFSITQTYSGALYIDNGKVKTLDDDVLGVCLTSGSINVTNLEVIGKTKTANFVTKDLNINGVKLPNSLTAPADAPADVPEDDITPVDEVASDKDIIPQRNENGVWEGIDIDSYLKRKIKTHFEKNYKTIPTGAIHWCYMTLEEYDKCGEDSILKKDFLLCDGRKYKKSSKLAKLAKVL